MQDKFSYVQLIDKRKLKRLKRKNLIHPISMHIILDIDRDILTTLHFGSECERKAIYNKFTIGSTDKEVKIFYSNVSSIRINDSSVDPYFTWEMNCFVIFRTIQERAKFILMV